MKARSPIGALIKRFNLKPLDLEGGYFAQTFYSPHLSAIYYFLTPETFSALHKLTSIEVFHYYAGDTVELSTLTEKGILKKILLGNPGNRKAVPQYTVLPGVWQGSRIAPRPKVGWSLLGCTVSPGYDQKQFTLGDRVDLLKLFPQHKSTILKLTR